VLLFTFILPTIIPYYFWNEDLLVSYLICIMRYVIALHITWCVNSFAHIWGDKPYDKHINPVENLLISFLAIGEG
jgi:stearoyl-CoA desaturase (delta-9 desaturase)